jgi:WD40 repeat protein
VKIETLAVSPDGSLLAAGEFREQVESGVRTTSGTLLLWDVDQRKVISDQLIGNVRLSSLNFSHDGEHLAVASGSTATVFDVRSGLTRLSPAERTETSTTGGVFLPDGRTVAWTQEILGGSSWIALQSSDESTEPNRIVCDGAAATLGVDAAGGQIFVGTQGGFIEARDSTPGARYGRLRQVLWGHSGRVSCLAVSPDGRSLASAGFDGTVRLWAIRETEDSRRLVGDHGAVTAKFIADGTRLLTCGGGVFSYAVNDWTSLPALHGGAIATPLDPRDSRFIVCTCSNGYVNSADALTGEYLATVRPNDYFSPALHLGLSGAADRLYVAWQTSDTYAHFGTHRGSSSVEEWSFDPPSLLRRLTTHEAAIRAMAVSDTSITVAKDGIDADIEVMDLATGVARVFEGHHGSTNALAFSPDGSLLAAACDDRNVYLWDVASGELVASLIGHIATPLCVAFMPDGQELASGDESGIVRVWNLKTFDVSLELKAHPEPVRSVAFSPDGWCLVTASHEPQHAEQRGPGEVRVWSARDASAVAPQD